MNLPNKLTILRMIMIVPFVVFMLTPLGGGAGKWIALALFVIASLTGLVEMGKIPAWVVIIIISREFIISGFRLVASDKGVVIAASYWGKFKTTFQMVMIVLMIADIAVLAPLTAIVMWIALILTIVSLADYLIKNKDVMKDPK